MAKVKVGDTLIYHPGTQNRPTCEATVTRVNDDGTVNIAYPHHANLEVMATADSCAFGGGMYQVQGADDEEKAQAVSRGDGAKSPELDKLKTANESLQSLNEGLQAQLTAAQAQLTAAQERIAELEATAAPGDAAKTDAA